MPQERKTYVCSKYPSYASHCTGENGKRIPILFVNGEFSTDNASVQKFVEGLHNFEIGVVAIKDPAAVKAAADAHDAKIKALAPNKEKAEKVQIARQDAAAKKAEADRASAKAQAEDDAKRLAEHNRIVSGIAAKEAKDKREAEKADKSDGESLIAAAEARAKSEADAATAAAEKKDGGSDVPPVK